MISPLLNRQEQSLADTPPAYSAPNQVAVLAAKAASGLSGVPNALASALVPGSPVLGGIAEALGAPLPSLTATVTANPNVRFGDKYVPQMVRDSMAGTDSAAGKIGSFVVSSGNSNAEARGQLAVGSAPQWVWWIVGGAVILGAIVWFLRRTK